MQTQNAIQLCTLPNVPAMYFGLAVLVPFVKAGVLDPQAALIRTWSLNKGISTQAVHHLFQDVDARVQAAQTTAETWERDLLHTAALNAVIQYRDGKWTEAQAVLWTKIIAATTAREAMRELHSVHHKVKTVFVC